MYEFLKNLSEKSNCQSMGICSIDPTVSAIEELLLSQIRQTCFYIIKLRELGQFNREIENNIIKGLSIVMLNTSFDKDDFMCFLAQLCKDKNATKERYMNICKQNRQPCELINTDEDFCEKSNLSAMIKIGEEKLQNKYRGVNNEKQRLLELITIFAKTSSIILQLLKKVKPDTSDFDFEVIRFFSLTNSISNRCEKLKRRILEFSKIGYQIQQQTSDFYENRYGKRTSAKILTTPIEGKAILISGPDIFELEKLLETIGNREINVYTNSLMYIAHTYPKFKKYKNLKGHLGTQNPQIDFSDFPGAILLTQNFSQKIDNLLRGTMYSNKTIAPNRMFKIKNNDYEPLIQSALKLDGFKKTKNKKYLELPHDFTKIETTLNELKDSSVVIIVGENSSTEDIQDFNGKKIINLDCPVETDLLLSTLKKCKDLNIKTDLFFTSCSISSINTLLCTLFMNLENTYLVNCSSSIISPHVLESLESDFEVNIIK